MSNQQRDRSRSQAELVEQAVQGISDALNGTRDLAVHLSGLSVKAPKGEGEELLIVIRGIDADGMPVVAFHSAFSLSEAVRGLAARLNNGTLRWRPDDFQ